MKTHQTVFLMAILFLTAVAGPTWAEEKRPVSWITAEEAALPVMQSPGRSAGEAPGSLNQPFPAGNREMAGPIIHIEKPDADKTYHDLIDILIRFEKNPVGGSINMESLRIIYLKMFGIDITDRIRPYIKETHIDASGVQFPEGEHEFEIRIKDLEQLESSRIIAIRVN